MSATDAVDLLEAVRQFLRAEVLLELEGFKAYNTRIAVNALGIVAREMQMGRDVAMLDQQMADKLSVDAATTDLSRHIALALRDGKLSADADLLAYLRKRTMLSMSIDNPKYSGLQQAKQRWPPHSDT
jgi:hypothetical protein